jgi:hypothetical protein
MIFTLKNRHPALGKVKERMTKNVFHLYAELDLPFLSMSVIFLDSEALHYHQM